MRRIGQAWANVPGLVTLFATFVVCAAILALVAGQAAVIVALATLAALVLAVVGVSASGIQFLQQARNLPVVPPREALLASPPVALRTFGLLGTVAAGIAGFTVAAVLLLLACQVPVAGALLYALLLPLLTLGGVAVAIAALGVVMLAAPALWSGRTLREAWLDCRAILLRRRQEVAAQLALLALLVAVALGVVVTIVSAAFGVTLTLSAMVLSPGILEAPSFARMWSRPELLGPGALGTGLLAAAVSTFVVAGAQFGLCLTYLNLAGGIDCVPGGGAVQSLPARLACPACSHPVTAEDAFCSQCGQTLG